MLPNNILIIKRRLFNFIYTVYLENKESEESICLFFENLEKKKIVNMFIDIETFLFKNNIKYKKEFKYYDKISFKENAKAFNKFIIRKKLKRIKKYIRKYITNGEG
jgi:hypothetical protein